MYQFDLVYHTTKTKIQLQRNGMAAIQKIVGAKVFAPEHSENRQIGEKLPHLVTQILM